MVSKLFQIGILSAIVATMMTASSLILEQQVANGQGPINSPSSGLPIIQESLGSQVTSSDDDDQATPPEDNGDDRNKIADDRSNSVTSVTPTSPGVKFRAPIATSGDNVYIAWSTDKGTPNNNSEIIFRASTDNGSTFGDKINLSNTSNIDSIDQEIAVQGENVFVTWWERNATSNTPVLRISNDNGETFGPALMLASNGTIGSSSEVE